MSNTNRVKPSLDDARARIDRAKYHTASLEREIAAVLPPDKTISTVMPAAGIFSGGSHRIKPPPIIPILIGEAVYNLRAALDYLVYELYYLDTGKPHRRTKFLIEDHKSGWKAQFSRSGTTGKQRRELWLDKLTVSHQTALKRLQPCYGCRWTRTLRDLSNPDKHRRLITVVANAAYPYLGAIPGPGIVTFKVTTKVAFEDASLVVGTLQLLQQEVADVIEAFDPDFQ